jgi:hypothetical protein
MKKKLLVLLIASIPTLMPNLASAVAIGSDDYDWVCTEYECSITHSSSVRESGVN